MKSYTDLEQSKKLAEILPIESADGFYEAQINPFTNKWEDILFVGNEWASDEVVIPTWSLAALLNILPSATLDSSDDHHCRLHCMERYTEWYDNAIDACVAMIERLHEQNLL